MANSDSKSPAPPPPPRLLRSPSRESVSTELSLFSISSAASEMSRAGLRVVLPPHLARGPSPTPEARHRLQFPAGSGGGGGSSAGEGGGSNLWGEEESDLIRSCAALSTALGVHKSFSTSDISGVGASTDGELSRTWVSEGNFLLQINVCGGGGRLEGVFLPRLDPTSRSCSTWVAVGDVASTSQLPSPQARPGSLESPAITAADFIRSVNKKVRQNYIKRRLVTTYKALQRFSQSEVDLEAGGVGTGGVKIDGGGVTLVVPPRQQAAQDVFRIIKKEVELPVTAPPTAHVASAHNKNLSLTARDVERDRGRPLTKYERNMMIFNWLQTLEETAYDIMS
ncbi:uncharacterized protein LOC121854674 isoform X2 [Homarus americanus]|uniref:uncharacterized protein LOC121854674 isoform X2 n=1 Tax=Homarus americanus TaxID=6706 RepID=UPI001C4618D4|nr:uncharacterized protein LOC121854674 isoform X2 [Homarus americanus]